MERPSPTDAHRLLHRFAGTWEGPEEIPGAPGGGAFQGRTTFRVDVDGLFILGEYEQRRDGAVSYRGHTVFGVDGATGEACWYWFDSTGMVPPAPSRGRWVGDTVTFEATFPQGAGRYTYALDGDRYRFTLAVAPDGKSFRNVMVGDYRKVG